MCSIQQFARLAGVTVKALRHYERMGLLLPARTAARHRRYTLADLSRLERVLALRTLGLPLATMRVALGGDLQLLRARLESLEQLRTRLDRAIEALRAIGQDPQPPEALDRFVKESTWTRWEGLRQLRASPAARSPDRVAPSRLALFQALAAALDENPDAPETRPLIQQWYETMEPETREAVRRRIAWPSGMRAYIASLYDATPEAWERVIAFLESRAERPSRP